jgi:hypothetical protein
MTVLKMALAVLLGEIAYHALFVVACYFSFTRGWAYTLMQWLQ